MNLLYIKIFLTHLTLIIVIVSCQEYDGVSLLGKKLFGENSNTYTANCVLGLSTKYFVDEKKLRGSIVIINFDSYASTIQKTILETIFQGSKYSVMTKDSKFRHRNASHFPEKAKNYLMILEHMIELDANIQQLNKLPTWNPHAKAIVYIQFREEFDKDDLVKSIINEFRKHKLLRSIVFVDFPETKEVKAYTWEPYSVTNCANTCEEVKLLDICKDNFIEQISEMIDIEEIPNLSLCPLNVFTVVSEPYVMPPTRKKTTSSYSDEYEFDLGIEINLLKMIADTSNMTLVIRFTNTTEDLGEIYPNKTVTGIFQLLNSGEVDSIIGNIETNEVMRKVFDSSCSYMQDDIAWCVPKAGNSLTWSNLVTIFTTSTWVTTLAAILVVASIFHWFKYKENSRETKWPTESILMTIGMVLGWGVLFKPKSTAFRLLLFSWLLFSLNINTTYQSFLRSFLIHPKSSKQISTVDEIMLTDFSVKGKDDILKHFNEENVKGLNAFVLKRFKICEKFEECINEVRSNKNIIVAGSRMQAKYQDLQIGKGSAMVFCLDDTETIYKYGVVILFRKWYPFLLRFNRIIRSVTENGLIWKWNNEVNTHPPVSEQNDMVPLGMKHVMGAFIFLSIGYCSCFVVCSLELLVYFLNKPKKKRRVRPKFIQ